MKYNLFIDFIKMDGVSSRILSVYEVTMPDILEILKCYKLGCTFNVIIKPWKEK